MSFGDDMRYLFSDVKLLCENPDHFFELGEALNGLRYWRVGGLRLAVETGKTQTPLRVLLARLSMVAR